MTDAREQAGPPGSTERGVVSFVARGRPRSANRKVGRIGEAAKAGYVQLFIAAGGDRSEDQCYAMVYYFAPGYRPENDADAGNVHKRVIDGLKGTAFEDDHIVRLVIAGVIDYGPRTTGPISLDQLDLTGLPGDLLREVAGLLDAGAEHFLYVEVGPLRPFMYRFNLGGSFGP